MSIFFLFKRTVGMLVQPLPMLYLLLLIGLALLIRNRRRRLTLACFICSFALLALSSFPPLTRWTARTLESGQTPLGESAAERIAPFAVVVLGSGVAHPGDAALPALSRLGDSARARLVEGVRLALLFPEARLITSGYGMGLENCADAMAEAAMELGIAGDRIDRLTQSLDTGHEARLVKEMAGDRKIVLVTSAAHMARSLAFFRESGVDVEPSACDYLAPVSDATLSALNRQRWRPKGENVSASEQSWHEFMGLAYYHWFRSGDKGE